ncbi:ESPR domain-containing protein [Stenotrophomonas sp. C3(2023)]|uniref:ESPR domain-containing protein n=1 Tax=Stenotrophomonas sp. C3(2023) TaxID=3080277 RepID=UPI00293CA0AA|nr:ESPR domain-containing protein [Stenotrophomonas sp. C3(2023)]MDV3467510.1 ESPR domain-containing protein [Stenotrophomonas sp. C3(2023)]
MNAVYKLIYNIATGTWSVAHELAACRGRTGRKRLAVAVAVALTLPVGVALAADAPQKCPTGKALSDDGLGCVSRVDATVPGPSMGTFAPSVSLGDGATAGGLRDIAIGSNAKSNSGCAPGTSPSDYSIAMGASSSVTRVVQSRSAEVRLSVVQQTRVALQ